jgi:glycolate oxidase FAD binding subunit
VVTPETITDLADALRRPASHSRTISLEGNTSKRLMAGPGGEADEHVSTTGLNRVLEYEPHDLTISVEAGLPWSRLTALLAENRQMLPLDPPFASFATVGGVIGANSSGPRRLLYGTARDMVIGMTFVTVEGKVVKSGGMVVKNVAGLDMAKLMIGSFGTLAAVAVVNFKIVPAPEVERSFLLPFDTLAAAIAARDRIVNGVLQPAALDLMNPAAGAAMGNRTWLLAVRAAGNAAAVERYERELSSLASGVAYDGEPHVALWQYLQERTPAFLGQFQNGAVVRVSCTLKEVQQVLESLPGPALARAGSGICYGYFERTEAATTWLAGAIQRGFKAVLEFCPEEWKRDVELWPAPSGDIEIMRRIKKLFDPENLLNRGRLYRRI